MASYPLHIESLDRANYEATSQLKAHSICLMLDPGETMEPFEEQARRVSNEYQLTTQDVDGPHKHLYLALFDGFASDGKELLLSDLGWDVTDSLVLLARALYSKAHMQPDERDALHAHLAADPERVMPAFRELDSQSKTWIERPSPSYEAADVLEQIVRIEAHPLQIRQEREPELHAYQ